MFLGDSQTMTSEAAILGTPALKCNTFAGKLSVPNELEEKYGLCYSYQPNAFDQFMNKAKELSETPNLKEAWAEKRQKFLNDKIDVTAFMVWFIENYPKSAKIMKENPDYQYRFK
jgi:predicted glycosyltransferase